MFRPRFFDSIRTITRKQFFNDVIAGVIVGVVAIPLAIAFAIASGVGPEKGLFTAIIAGFIIALLGGSDVQIGGPTGAFIVIVYGILLNHGIDGLIIATIMAGILLVLMGLMKFGSVIQFIPYPVVVGFTSGIALTIFSTQMNDFFGLGIDKVPAEFIHKWIAYAKMINHIDPWSLAIGACTIIIIVVWQRFNKQIPGALIALIIATAVVSIFNIPVETIGKRFGAIPTSLPMPVFPALSMQRIQQLISPAITIAILAGIESLLSAVVADGMIGKKHNSNTELIAQGLANIGSGLFGGIPATGAIARTATNIKNGGRTPVAGIVHAIVLLLVLLFLGNLAALIPMSCLAGILLIVSYNMSEWRSFKAILRCPKSDVLVLLTTFFLTVILDLTVAIQVGMLLALFLFMRRMSQVASISVIRDEYIEEKEINDPLSIARIDVPAGVEIYEINGAFFFGAAEKFKDEMLRVEKPPKVRILRMRHVQAIDSSGIRLLEDICKDSAKRGVTLILSGVHSQTLDVIRQTGLDKTIGIDNIKANIHEAIDRAKLVLGIEAPTISSKLRLGGVHTLAGGKDSCEVIREAIPLFGIQREEHRSQLSDAILERELMMGTGMGKGIAFPHPRNPIAAKDIPEFISVCYLDSAVDFGAPDGIAAFCAIFLVSSNAKSHLETLSTMGRLCSQEAFIKLLESRTNLEGLIEYIENQG